MKKTYIYAACAIICWSTVPTVTKLLLGALNNFQVLWISSFFAFLFLLTANILTGKIKTLKHYKRKDYFASVMISLPSTLFYYLFYYAGTDMMPASQAFIVNYLWPIMSVIFSCILLKEKLNIRKCIAILLSFTGVIIVAGGTINGSSENVLSGALCCMLGAVSYGIFTALNKKYSYDKMLSMMMGSFTTFLITSIINSLNGNLFVPSLFQGFGFIWNGVFSISVANLCWVLALRSGDTAKVSNLAYVTPFISLVWTILFLHEPIQLRSILGLAVIITGIFIQMDTNKDKEVHYGKKKYS